MYFVFENAHKICCVFDVISSLYMDVKIMALAGKMYINVNISSYHVENQNTNRKCIKIGRQQSYKITYVQENFL